MAQRVCPGSDITAPSANVAWKPQPRQIALLTCPIIDILYGGSRGGGKTDGFLGKWAQRYQIYGGFLRGIFVRRTYDELDEVIARSLEIYPSIGGIWKAQKRTWYFPGGARLKMRALQRDIDASKFQGHSYTDIYIDEAGNFPDSAPLDKLRATLRNPHGIPPTYNLSANPGGPGHQWIKKRYIDPAPDGMRPIRDLSTNEARIYIPSRLEDNKILLEQDPDYANRIKLSGEAWLVQAWLKGDWNAAPEGGLIKLSWFKRYRYHPAEILRIVHSWDTAYKDDQVNDPSVCTVWAETPDRYVLLDVFRERLQYPELKRAVKNMAAKWKPDAILIEDKSSGQSLIQELRNDPSAKFPVIAIQCTDDRGKSMSKVDRLVKVSSIIESGLVEIPEEASWLLDYELELTLFPLAAHDDQVDSTSQALRWMYSNTVNLDATAASHRRRTGADTEKRVIDTQTGYGRIRSRADTGGFI